ncbi:hypothetical protein GALMADRAFT_281378 [Galerina marginata CBS 339.88]|uniref:Uncharacterized protein n=1 Tax=Galerina marginata (strain CBS 339.88) TaxID=685588 RepID=A0A067SY93_GALM3|nr:hypothetical protein GALMADRAFT_281378 [Galerina marginata CBS 339.88]
MVEPPDWFKLSGRTSRPGSWREKRRTLRFRNYQRIRDEGVVIPGGEFAGSLYLISSQTKTRRQVVGDIALGSREKIPIAKKLHPYQQLMTIASLKMARDRERPGIKNRKLQLFMAVRNLSSGENQSNTWQSRPNAAVEAEMGLSVRMYPRLRKKETRVKDFSLSAPRSRCPRCSQKPSEVVISNIVG